MNLLAELTKDVVNLIYPNTCQGCGTELVGNENLICVACWKIMPKTNFHLHKNNPAEQKFWGRVKIEHASAMFYFNKDTRIQSVLHALKYQNKKEIGFELGQRYGKELTQSEWINETDVLLPIPLSKQKLKFRGYNQSEWICKGIGTILNIPVNTHSIIRSKNTRSQTTMSITDRIQNVKNAFTVHDSNDLNNKHIVLLDDVLTTGATLESCAREILKIGNTKVSVLTIAYAII